MSDLASLLDDVERWLARFVAYPSRHELVAHVLWVPHAHVMDEWESTPRLAFLSPEPSSGKTRALEVTEPLVPRPVEAVDVTPSYLFRKVGGDDGRPTILFDEIDTVFGPKARENEELRALLNAGHRKGAVAGRSVVRGKVIEPVDFPAYCALAMAGLGGLPDTLLTRAVVIRMRRRGPVESVEPYRRRLHAPEGVELGKRLAEWGESFTLDDWPAMPPGVEDRDADKWEALLAVADAARGDWPSRARSAAVALVALSKESSPSLGVRLLDDLRDVFAGRDELTTKEVLELLCKLEEAPWGDLYGKPLDARGLARRLGAYGVKSTKLRVGDTTPRGYRRADLADSWSRCLPSPIDVEQVEQVEHARSASSDADPNVPDVPLVPLPQGERETRRCSPTETATAGSRLSPETTWKCRGDRSSHVASSLRGDATVETSSSGAALSLLRQASQRASGSLALHGLRRRPRCLVHRLLDQEAESCRVRRVGDQSWRGKRAL
jgi:hypothetical protein